MLLLSYSVERHFQQYSSYIAEASAPIHAFLEFFLTSTPHNILSKPLAAFPYNHCRNNGQRNDSCLIDYHQSSERILAEPEIETATSCSQVRNATDWAMGLGQSDPESTVPDTGVLAK